MMSFNYFSRINKDEAITLLLCMFCEVNLELDYEDARNTRTIEKLAEYMADMHYPEAIADSVYNTIEEISLKRTKLGELL